MRHLLTNSSPSGDNQHVDPRIAKTRARLQRALFELADEKGIDRVTVSDITHRAEVNRTTFYLHYADAETLLADAIDGVAERALLALEEIDIASAEPPAQLTEFLRHTDENARLYRQVFTEPGYAVALSRLKDRLIGTIYSHADADGAEPPADIPLPIFAASVAGSILGVIGAWLEGEDRAEPAVVAKWIWEISRPASGRGA